MTPEGVRQEIESLTAELISAGICIDQNFPALRRTGSNTIVDFGKEADLSVTLKNTPYTTVYEALSKSRSFNIKMIDGGLIQMMYIFDAEQLRKHRLAFFPSPDLLEYQNNSDVYEADEIYADVIERNVVTVPVRFDLDMAAAVDYEHPASHMTLGQYRNCRIPVSSAITPFYFMNFILRAFYNTPFRKFCTDLKAIAPLLPDTLTAREGNHMHLRVSVAATA